MFTLQILDRGQTFLHPIDGKAILLGSGPSADVVLGEAGVAPAHARIEPHADGARLTALVDTVVNGRKVGTVELALGDRIEVGRAVLVVGRSVTRAASADDVLGDALPRSVRRSPKARRRGPLLIAAAAVGAMVWLLFWSPLADRVGDELAAIRRWRTSGQVDRASEAITALQQRWQDATDDRLQRLAVERDAVAAVALAIDRLTNKVLDPNDARGYAEWGKELQRLEQVGEAEDQAAARQVRDQLAVLMLERAKLRTAANASPRPPAPPTRSEPVTPVAATVAAPGGTPSAPAPTAPAPAIPTETGSVSATGKMDTGEADRLAEQGLFVQAIALLHASLAEQDDEAAVSRLQSRAAAVRGQAKQAMATLLGEATRVAGGGDMGEAARLLHASRHRFPPDAEFAAIDADIARYETAVVATSKPAPAVPGAASPPVDERARAATLAAVRAYMDSVRTAEEKGNFAAAAQQLRAAAAAVRERDADFAARLDVRADEAQWLLAWHEAVAGALQGGRTLATTRVDGQAVTLTGSDGASLVGSSGERLTWLDIGAGGVQAIADQLKVAGTPSLGAAALLYKQGQSAAAEALLAKVLRADPGNKDGIDRVIARGRGEPFDGKGYALDKTGFQSVRTLEVEKQAALMAGRLEVALRDKAPAKREAFWAEAMAAGPEVVPVLTSALQKELKKQIAKLDTGALKKQVDRLAAQRALLDDARKTAKELIFDEQKYFYPYKPPAVSSDKFAEYSRVQAEVDRRVAALRTLWNDDKVRVRVPAGLRSDLDRLDWVAKGLADLGELDHGVLAQVEWVRALPAGDSVGVRDYCATMAERGELEEWRHVEAYNQLAGKPLSSAQRELLKITNEYRVMFGHRPLAIVPTICAASQGHAEEMARLGYFAHMSPTPGRTTPYDRMRLAGYKFGVSENIALVDGANGAHVAWCHSSGHHRNLLDASHYEIGIGADGRLWVQNFGSGKVHRDEPAWNESRANGR